MTDRQEQEGAELLYNADILCMDDARSRAEALIHSGGRILFTGSEAAARDYLSAQGLKAGEKDCEGSCILPGFIDTHLHPMLMAVFDYNADLNGVSSPERMEEIIKDKAARTAPGEWVLGLQLDEKLLPSGALPDRHILDRICPDKPLVIFKRDGHSLTANTRALEAAGLTSWRGTVQGGTVECDAAGLPTGIFRENAVGLVMEKFQGPDLGTLLESTRATLRKLPAQGITSIGAILQTDREGPSGSSGQFESDLMAALAADSPFSIYAILIGQTVPDMRTFAEKGLADPAKGHKAGAFKIFADGTLGSCTACMHQGFFDHPHQTGYMTLGEEDIYRRMEEAHLKDLQICIHAIGDKAIATCAALYERLLRQHPRQDHRHRIEHASVVPPGTLKQMAALGIAVSCQPLFIRSEKHWLHERLGPERAAQAYPFRSFLEAGILIAGSSDAPIESTSVLEAIECCVTRDGFETTQALSVDQALALYTRNAARLQFEETEKGTLEAGKRSDFVRLDRNPHEVPPTEIGKIRVLETVWQGQTTFGS